jgi:hypothetical protein
MDYQRYAMDRQLVAKTWVNYGLTDLFFAFDSDDDAFSDNVLFSAYIYKGSRLQIS